MKTQKQKWEQILKIMESSMKPAKYQLWISELELIKVDEELKAVFVSARDPFKGAYAMSIFGEELDRAAENIYGTGYKVYVTYDKGRKLEDDFLSVRDNEFTLVEHDDGYEHRVRMLLLTNTDITDDELYSVTTRMQSRIRMEKAKNKMEEIRLAELEDDKMTGINERNLQENIEMLGKRFEHIAENLNEVSNVMIGILDVIKEKKIEKSSLE